MSVLIKGMKMPSVCDECWALDESGDYPICRITEETRGYNFRVREKRMDRCPLIELPDHGDLIDRDVFRNMTGIMEDCNECKHKGNLYGCKGDISLDYICGMLDDMPVAIPAERSEE